MMNTSFFKHLVPTVLFVLLSAIGSVPPASATDITSNNLVIVLDASGSMDGKMKRVNRKKMDAAKDALIQVIQTLMICIPLPTMLCCLGGVNTICPLVNSSVTFPVTLNTLMACGCVIGFMDYQRIGIGR